MLSQKNTSLSVIEGLLYLVKRSALRWFGHIERMENKEFVEVYLSCVEGPNMRGRPVGKWDGRVKEYVSEKGVRKNGLDWLTPSLW